MSEKMKSIIAEQLNIDASEITLESSFKDDLNADSLDLFEMVMALEDNYGVEIPSEDLEKLLTVGDVVNYLKDKGVKTPAGVFLKRAEESNANRYNKAIRYRISDNPRRYGMGCRTPPCSSSK